MILNEDYFNGNIDITQSSSPETQGEPDFFVSIEQNNSNYHKAPEKLEKIIDAVLSTVCSIAKYEVKFKQVLYKKPFITEIGIWGTITKVDELFAIVGLPTYIYEDTGLCEFTIFKNNTHEKYTLKNDLYHFVANALTHKITSHYTDISIIDTLVYVYEFVTGENNPSIQAKISEKLQLTSSTQMLLTTIIKQIGLLFNKNNIKNTTVVHSYYLQNKTDSTGSMFKLSNYTLTYNGLISAVENFDIDVWFGISNNPLNECLRATDCIKGKENNKTVDRILNMLKTNRFFYRGSQYIRLTIYPDFTLFVYNLGMQGSNTVVMYIMMQKEVANDVISSLYQAKDLILI